jgi:serine/threonine protein kinase
MPTPPPPSTSGSPSVEEFLRTILKSKLMDQPQLEGVLRYVPAEESRDADFLSEYLIRTGWLSRFQAGKLLRGQSRGLILGPFQLLAPIGRGGMGTVFLARDQRVEHLVALKILPPQKARERERLLDRFRREMLLSQCLSHPNLARTYEAGEIAKVHYLAMEFIPGQNLARLVNSQGPLEVSRTARLMAEVCCALEQIHSQGVIHRDLKPGNIMVTPNDHAKLLDLGLALIEEEKATDISVVGGQGYIVGTMDYIAPEQSLNPLEVDGRADVYALGCVTFFALTGQPPFPGGSRREKIYKHRDKEPPRLLDLRPAVPPGFAEIVGRMMAKDRQDRYSSAHAVAEALAPWADQANRPLENPEDPAYTQAVLLLRTADRASEDSVPDVLAAEESECEAANERAPQDAPVSNEWIPHLAPGDPPPPYLPVSPSALPGISEGREGSFDWAGLDAQVMPSQQAESEPGRIPWVLLMLLAASLFLFAGMIVALLFIIWLHG